MPKKINYATHNSYNNFFFLSVKKGKINFNLIPSKV